LEETVRLQVAEFDLCGSTGPPLAFGVAISRASLRLFAAASSAFFCI
jgi:hypothetical protein